MIRRPFLRLPARMNTLQTPLLTLAVHEALLKARSAGGGTLECSLDLGLSRVSVDVGEDAWRCDGRDFPFMAACKERTVYWWTGAGFEPVSRYSGSLIKLVPTDWGPPTFEIDGIKMLPTAQVSPYADAERKVGLIQPAGKAILDTCGGLGYFAAWCLRGGARQVASFEKNPDVIWLRTLNPWSPTHSGADANPAFSLTNADVSEQIATLPSASFDAALHDPPRFGIAGELYSQAFYDQLARVLRPRGRLFHYTGSPNKLTSGRDVPREVANRLQKAGFATQLEGDGVLAVKGGGPSARRGQAGLRALR
ncbi:class I SAM-dependent methyltransferase [Hydrocarboniphaga effusa]|jgi:predicted methyltransferase|uniref:class I SAM-dependent methyltransferase n=1 Tax=Hydrocarboniphaga effusa TaxID=243629 RepID=UPI0035B07687